MSKYIHKSCKFFFGFILLLLCTSCTQNSPSSKTNLLLDWWPNPNHVPIYVGIERGIFQKHGINLQLLSLQEPPDALVYLLSHQADLALYYTPRTLMRYAKSPNFKIIGKLHEHALYAFMSRKDSHITHVQDFHGKSLGMYGDFLSQATLQNLSEQGINLSVTKLVQFEPITMLYTKTLDIISSVYWNIEPFQLRSQGVEVNAFKWNDFGFPDYPELVFVSSNEFLQKNPLFAARFREAIQESITFCIQNPEDAFQIYLLHNPEKKHLIWEKEAWDATYPILATSQYFDIPMMEAFYLWLEDCKILSKKFNVREVLDQTL